MSWLFCCGDNKQKTQDLKSTMDLSRPIMPTAVSQVNGHLKIDDEIEGLSGKQSAQSQLLSDIIAQKNAAASEKLLIKGFQTQFLFSTESEESTPFARAVGALNNGEEIPSDSRISNAQLNQRVMNDKRLNNYLMQAQKMMSRKNEPMAQKSENGE